MVEESGTVRRERRRAERTAAVLAVGLETAAKGARHGVTRDLSTTGLLVVTPSALRAGERVRITIHTGGADAYVDGRVARIDENPISSPELWRWRVGIELDSPLPNGFVGQGLRLSRLPVA